MVKIMIVIGTCFQMPRAQEFGQLAGFHHEIRNNGKFVDIIWRNLNEEQILRLVRLYISKPTLKVLTIKRPYSKLTLKDQND